MGELANGRRYELRLSSQFYLTGQPTSVKLWHPLCYKLLQLASAPAADPISSKESLKLIIARVTLRIIGHKFGEKS